VFRLHATHTCQRSCSNSTGTSAAVCLRLCVVWGSHGGCYENGCLLGCRTVESSGSVPAFRRYLLSPSSGRWLLVNLCCITRLYNPENSYLHCLRLGYAIFKFPHFIRRISNLLWCLCCYMLTLVSMETMPLRLWESLTLTVSPRQFC
jgi:hypothetical protein